MQQIKTPLPFFLTLGILLCPLLLSGQSAQPAFRHYSTEDGLPSPEVYEVLQDRHGFLWFGTDNGVSRFNGYEFENFGPEQGLNNVVVYYLYEDYKDGIWMVTSSENLYYYDYAADSIQAYAYNGSIQAHVVQRRGTPGIFVDSLDTVYRTLSEQGVIRIGSSGQVAIYPDSIERGPSFIEMAGNLFFTEGGEFSKDLRANNKFPIFFYGKKEPAKVILPLITESSSGGNYFLQLSDGSLLCFTKSAYYAFKGRELQWYRPGTDFPLVSSWQAKNGAIYLGGDQGTGVRVFSGEKALANNEYLTLLKGYTVSHILEDRQGGYWFTTTQDGVFYSPGLNYRVYGRAGGLPEDNITALAAGRDTIVAATRQGQLFWLSQQPEKVRLLRRPWGKAEVFDLEKGADGNIWIGTGIGVYLFDRSAEIQGHSITIYSQEHKRFQKAVGTKGITLPLSSSHLFLRLPYGFARYQIEADTVDYFSFNSGFRERLYAIYEDFQGRLWIGMFDGLFQFAGDSLLRPQPFFPKMGLRVERIAQLADSTLVIGTKGGGVLLWKDEHYLEITKADGLTSDMVETLHIDSAQHIWVGTLQGLNKITLYPEVNVKTFTTRNGLPSNEINEVDSYGDQVWAATRGGLLKLPAERKTTAASPAPLLEEVRVNGQERPAAAIDVLPFRENDLRFTFLSINYFLDGHIPYRYRLSADEPWVNTQNRQVDFAALAPGQYRFEVQAQNEDGIWSDSTVLPFRILPPFWAAWWFWAIIGAMAAGIGYLFYRNRMELYKKEVAYQRERANAEKEKAELEKEMSHLQATALRAQMNPHFIFNCLNSIQGFIAVGDKTNAMRYLARFAKLVRSTLDSSLENRISLDQEVAMLESYLALEQMRFDEKFEFQLTVADNIGRETTQLPPLLVQPFVENAIIHGLSDASRKGRIDICYEQDNGNLKVTVTDNGIGIRASEKKKQANSSLHKSVGMTLTRKRLELLDQSGKEENVVVEELTDEAGKVNGTRVTVWIRRF